MNSSTEMNAEKLLEHIEQRQLNIDALKKYWQLIFPARSPCVTDAQLRLWLTMHTFAGVVYGLTEASIKYQKLGEMSDDYIARFASKCMLSFRDNPKNIDLNSVSLRKMPPDLAPTTTERAA